MNAYHELIKHLKTTFEEDDLVSTVTTSGYADMDNWKKDVYPIVDIYVVDSPFTGKDSTALSIFNVEITCLDIRDVNKEDTLDRFWHNDNRHDNWNTCHAILKKAQNKLIKDHLGTNITLDSATSLERLVFVKENTLDGWQVTWTISVPDTLTTIC